MKPYGMYTRSGPGIYRYRGMDAADTAVTAAPSRCRKLRSGPKRSTRRLIRRLGRIEAKNETCRQLAD